MIRNYWVTQNLDEDFEIMKFWAFWAFFRNILKGYFEKGRVKDLEPHIYL